MQISLFDTLAPTDPSEAALPTRSPIDLATPLDCCTWFALDVETTGTSPLKNALTEVTALQYCGAQEVGKFSTLVQPTEPIPAALETYTGITNAMVASAPPLAQVMADLAQFLGANPILVGHNVAFDFAFLQQKSLEVGLTAWSESLCLSRQVCSLALARTLVPGLPSYEGLVVATALQVKNPQAHRAETDARMAMGIVQALLVRLAATPETTCHTIANLLQAQGPLKAR